MRKRIFILFTVLLFSCSDDSTSPSEDLIVGKWGKEVSVGGEEGILIIDFKANKDYFVFANEGTDIELVRTGIYSFDGNIIKMKDDGCDEEEGEYRLEFTDNQVEFILINDECDRAQFIQGIFIVSEINLPEN